MTKPTYKKGRANSKHGRCRVAQPAVRSPGRPGLSSLPIPPQRFDLAYVDSFETQQQAESEDRTRALDLRAQAGRDPINARRLRGLADRIDPDVTADPDTPASSRFMRDQRRRIIGAVWQLFHAPRI